MLRHLYIRDFVIIDELNLDLHSGFSAFTGETGAGKSIFIDAISLLCADRASAMMVAKGKDKAIIEGTFDLKNDKTAAHILQDAGFDLEEETVFTREISAAGKSVSRIDHRVVSLSLMKECLKNQIDIHNQRDTQYLLNVGSHIQLLDEFTEDQVEKQAVGQAYLRYQSLLDEKNSTISQSYNDKDIEYAQYEIQEIDQAELKEGEEEELSAKEKDYHAVRSSLEKLNQIVSIYDDSVSGNLYEMNRLLQTLAVSDSLSAAKSAVNDSYYAIDDALAKLKEMLNSYEMSEEDINAVEARLFAIQNLKRKYGNSIPMILQRKNELQKMVDVYQHKAEYIHEIDQKIASALADYQQKAEILSKLRKESCVKLDRAVAKNLKDLVLPNARFQTKISEGKPSVNGSDHVEFLISMNKGEDLKPLVSTASGGELSRLMLGLKVIFTKLQGIHTVIFDEIDSGVSGPVASAIGMKMKSLSADCQVFAVTHLAPVAAWADHHYLVQKKTAANRTLTTVSELNEAGRIDQLALIASGSVTSASRTAAKELYHRSQK